MKNFVLPMITALLVSTLGTGCLVRTRSGHQHVQGGHPSSHRHDHCHDRGRHHKRVCHSHPHGPSHH